MVLTLVWIETIIHSKQYHNDIGKQFHVLLIDNTVEIKSCQTKQEHNKLYNNITKEDKL